MTTKVGSRPLVMTGEFIMSALRASSTPYDLASGARMSITIAQVRAILEGRARIEGDTENGLEYIEEPVGIKAAKE